MVVDGNCVLRVVSSGFGVCVLRFKLKLNKIKTKSLKNKNKNKKVPSTTNTTNKIPRGYNKISAGY